MATLTIRQLDDACYARLKREAKANHRSVEAEARYRLEHGRPIEQPMRGLANRFRQTMIDPGPGYEGSVALIRAVRDEGMIVVDASLVIKWRLAEADSASALAFLETWESRLCGPDLLAVEVCRALVAAANARRIPQPSAREAIADWLETIDRGEIPLYPLDSHLMTRGADIALDLGHPLSDCLYLALALDIGADLATCDAKFAARARPTYPNVRLLEDYAGGDAN